MGILNWLSGDDLETEAADDPAPVVASASPTTTRVPSKLTEHSVTVDVAGRLVVSGTLESELCTSRLGWTLTRRASKVLAQMVLSMGDPDGEVE